MMAVFRMAVWTCTVLLLLGISQTADALSAPNPGRVLRVCQSPGCKDDGAATTLDCLAALAPPGVDVTKGGCVSLCGSGPVVEICNDVDDVQSIKKKRVKGADAILQLLDECIGANEGEEDTEPILKPYMRDRLISGYDLSLEATSAYDEKQYQSAVDLYTEAIESGRKPALLLQDARDAAGSTSNTDEGYPSGVQWLVTSFKNACRARLALKDIDGARRDAFAATVFSQNLDPDAHECLAEVSAASGDSIGELQATKAAIGQHERMEEVYSQPLPGADAPRRAEAVKKKSNAAARKRELGFRAAKLERELKG
ncbi:hypothetical protein ACHAXT_004724 [Thalassiosira profunda]